MTRARGTGCGSGSFSDTTIEAVWNKGVQVDKYDPNVYRKDTCGAWMQRTAYGDATHQWGWEIDHIQPCAKGGTDELSNLQPLHHENNRGKGDDWPKWSCTKAS